MFNSPSKTVLSGWKVLVVDDDTMSRDVARLMLKHYGAEVQTAVDGIEGLEAALTLLPRLILTDLSMPRMNGWELVEALKKDVRTKDIPVIALTAHAMYGDRERALAAGCHNYMTKPLTPSTFMRELVRLLVDIPQLKPLLNSASKEN
jgi:CheY-like chemotaxis protein